MAKLMVVTVGTSLLQSASWDKDNVAFKEFLGDLWENYADDWCLNEGDKGLHSPRYRAKHDNGIEELLQAEIRKDNAEEWADWLAPYDAGYTPTKRYSGEITTILRLAEIEGKGAGWKTFLEGYTIKLAHDANSAEATFPVAHHLKAYLQRISENVDIETEPISYFSNSDHNFLRDGLRTYADLLNNAGEKYDAIHLVISGGFKVYSTVAARFLENLRFKIIYQHEQSDNIIVHDKKSVRISTSAASSSDLEIFVPDS